MADWTDLPNPAVQQGGLPSGATVTALRDNPIAIAEGQPGAPRISLLALEPILIGDTIRLAREGSVSKQGTGFQAVLTAAFCQWGEVRVTFQYSRSGGGTGNIEVQVVRQAGYGNVTILNSWVTNTTSWQNASIDVSVSPGDLIQVAVQGSGGGTPSEGAVRQTRFRTAEGSFIWPGLQGLVMP